MIFLSNIILLLKMFVPILLEKMTNTISCQTWRNDMLRELLFLCDYLKISMYGFHLYDCIVYFYFFFLVSSSFFTTHTCNLPLGTCSLFSPSCLHPLIGDIIVPGFLENWMVSHLLII